MNAIVVITTVGSEQQALLLAEELVARRHCACVNVLPGVQSTYRWKGKICRDKEYMLVIKTTEAEYEAVHSAIGELHTYELPEILAFRVHLGDPRFLRWIDESLDKSADFSDEVEETVPTLGEYSPDLKN